MVVFLFMGLLLLILGAVSVIGFGNYYFSCLGFVVVVGFSWVILVVGSSCCGWCQFCEDK